jgi:hypothetical protein
MPLLKARENLELARARVLEDQYKDAAAPLRAAAEALADYARQFPGPRADQAESLRKDIDAFAKRVRERPTDTVDRINSWLDPVNTWYAAAEH